MVTTWGYGSKLYRGPESPTTLEEAGYTSWYNYLRAIEVDAGSGYSTWDHFFAEKERLRAMGVLGSCATPQPNTPRDAPSPTGRKFLAYLEGQGDGCDYTIGCNTRLGRLKATTMEEAIAEAVGEWTPYDDEHIAKITVLEVVSEVDCADAIQRARDRYAKRQQEVETHSKRALLEQLKRELGE